MTTTDHALTTDQKTDMLTTDQQTLNPDPAMLTTNGTC